MASTKKTEAKAAAKAAAPVPKAAEVQPSALVIVPAGGIEQALNPDPIPEGDKKRALELLRHSSTCPNHAIIKRKLSVLDPRAVVWAAEECERLEETSLYYVAKSSQYDLGVLRAVTVGQMVISPDVLPPAAAELAESRRAAKGA